MRTELSGQTLLAKALACCPSCSQICPLRMQSRCMSKHRQISWSRCAPWSRTEPGFHTLLPVCTICFASADNKARPSCGGGVECVEAREGGRRKACTHRKRKHWLHLGGTSEQRHGAKPQQHVSCGTSLLVFAVEQCHRCPAAQILEFWDQGSAQGALATR
jgi:hypothetical protein